MKYKFKAKIFVLSSAMLLVSLMLVTIVFAATVYMDPADFETAAAGLGDPVVIDFEDYDASPVNGSVRYRTPFPGDYYVGLGLTFVSPTRADDEPRENDEVREPRFGFRSNASHDCAVQVIYPR